MKQLFKSFVFAVLLLWTMGMGGCDVSGTGAGFEEEKKPETLSILTWNVQALFDGEETGYEYDEYLNSEGWSQEKYSGRLNVLAQGISAIEPGPPDILALEEVENAGVLEDLARGPLEKIGYNWTFFANNTGSSLGIGVLSRFPLINTKAHSLSFNGETAPRPVMEVWVQAGDAALALFICHWKSKLGGDDSTESMRQASARIILRRMREIQKENPGTPTAVMGDLNENHDEFYRRSGAVICALLPDDPRAAVLAGLYGINGEDGGLAAEKIEKQQADFLVLGKTKPPEAVYFPRGTLMFYSPWEQDLENGSYYYQNAWETIDHFLLSEAFFDGSGWDYDFSAVLNQTPFTTAKGFPSGYNPRTGSGLSDHLPLKLVLKLYP
jgi:endonuclease/exonuclease/phosphatase family metal-dependent hydrolase